MPLPAYRAQKSQQTGAEQINAGRFRRHQMADPAALGQPLVDDNFMTQNLHLLDVSYATEDHLSSSIRVLNRGNSRIPAFL